MVGVLAGVLLAKDECDSINQAREPRSCRFDSSRGDCRETRCNRARDCIWDNVYPSFSKKCVEVAARNQIKSKQINADAHRRR